MDAEFASVRFYIVDVFAESRFSGNQLAVFRDSGKLSTPLMQEIAKEMHFSETTFITSERQSDGGYDVRIFTPDSELPFAGHPTLGTAYVIQTQIIGRPTKTVKLNLKIGQIPVTFSFRDGKPDLIWMRQRPPTFGRKFEPRQVSPILGLSPSAVDTKFPLMEVSTGLSFVIVPLKDLESVKKVRLDHDASEKFLKATDSIGFLVFSPETYLKENDPERSSSGSFTIDSGRPRDRVRQRLPCCVSSPKSIFREGRDRNQGRAGVRDRPQVTAASEGENEKRGFRSERRGQGSIRSQWKVSRLSLGEMVEPGGWVQLEDRAEIWSDSPRKQPG